MSAGDRAINYAGMAFGGLLGFAVGLLIYRRTMARAAELAAEGLEGDDEGVDGMLPGAEDLDDEDDNDGENSRLVRSSNANAGDSDAAALMDDDDISLWGAEDVEDAGAYHDWDEEAAVGGTGRKSNGFANGE
jgi:hypothetical protein